MRTKEQAAWPPGTLVTWPGTFAKNVYIYQGVEDRPPGNLAGHVLVDPRTGEKLFVWKQDVYPVEGRQ
jgi:hypothetical protein